MSKNEKITAMADHETIKALFSYLDESIRHGDTLSPKLLYRYIVRIRSEQFLIAHSYYESISKNEKIENPESEIAENPVSCSETAKQSPRIDFYVQVE
jgi:hypothetical protein